MFKAAITAKNSLATIRISGLVRRSRGITSREMLADVMSEHLCAYEPYHLNKKQIETIVADPEKALQFFFFLG